MPPLPPKKKKKKHNSSQIKSNKTQTCVKNKKNKKNRKIEKSNEPLRMPRKLIQQDRDAVDGAAALEVRLDLLGRGGVVDVTDEDAPGVDVLLVLAQVVAVVVELRLHLAQLGRFLLHLRDAALHG